MQTDTIPRNRTRETLYLNGGHEGAAGEEAHYEHVLAHELFERGVGTWTFTELALSTRFMLCATASRLAASQR